MSTLIDELEQAADRVVESCCAASPEDMCCASCSDIAARLRQRAAWVRELAVERHISPALFDALAGPIPPAEPGKPTTPREGRAWCDECGAFVTASGHGHFAPRRATPEKGGRE